MVCGSHVEVELQQRGDCEACQYSREEGEAPQLLHPLFLQGSEALGSCLWVVETPNKTQPAHKHCWPASFRSA